MAKKTTKVTRLVNALQSGKGMTAEQIVRRVGYSSTGTVRSVISGLTRNGFNVTKGYNKSGTLTYQI